MKKAISPLRYPGGKAKLYNYTKELIENNNLRGCMYGEAFAGGCGLALLLLENGIVSHLLLNDIDRAIYSFWYSVLNHTEKLINLINETEVTIEEWHKQKNIYRKSDKEDLLTLGFATLFLNRTNRSGIMKAGPIGGQSQSGAYKLDCRFKKQDLIEKIIKVSKYKDRMTLFNLDALDYLKEVDNLNNPDTFLFLDPPYFIKGKGLYTNFYNLEDHKNLSEHIASLNINWVVTYDNVEEIAEIYNKFNQQQYQLSYSAHKKYKGEEIMIYSPEINTLSFEAT